MTKKKENQIPTKTKIASLVLLFIMILSIGGFALTLGGGQGQTIFDSQSDIPLQQIQDQGETLWVTVRNSELFVFNSIDIFLGDSVSETLAERIKLNRQLFLYVDPSFASSEAQFLIEKALYGINIDVERVFDEQCTPDTLIIAPDNASYEGDCIVFQANDSAAYSLAESLTYHLVK